MEKPQLAIVKVGRDMFCDFGHLAVTARHGSHILVWAHAVLG